MEAANTSEKSVNFYQTTWRNNPERQPSSYSPPWEPEISVLSTSISSVLYLDLNQGLFGKTCVIKVNLILQRSCVKVNFQLAKSTISTHKCFMVTPVHMLLLPLIRHITIASPLFTRLPKLLSLDYYAPATRNLQMVSMKSAKSENTNRTPLVLFTVPL
jgi:hypothetical protein